MGSLTKAAILAAAKPRTEDVEIPGLGGTITLRGLTARERELWEQDVYDLKAGKVRAGSTWKTSLLAKSIMNGDGKPMFTPKELGELPAAVTEPLFDAASKLNRLTDGDVEELAGN